MSVLVAQADVYVRSIGGVVRRGETVRSGHPILDGILDLFEESPEPVEVPTYELDSPPKRGPGRPPKNKGGE